MPTRITTVLPAHITVRAAANLAVGITAAAILTLSGCSDSKSGSGSGSKPAGSSSPASGSGSGSAPSGSSR